MYLVIIKCVTTVKVSNFSGHYLRNRSTLDICVLGYIGIVQHKEHSPEVLSIPPGTRCIAWGSRQIYHKIEEKWIWVVHSGGAEDSSSGMLLLCRYYPYVSKVPSAFRFRQSKEEYMAIFFDRTEFLFIPEPLFFLVMIMIIIFHSVENFFTWTLIYRVFL